MTNPIYNYDTIRIYKKIEFEEFIRSTNPSVWNEGLHKTKYRRFIKYSYAIYVKDNRIDLEYSSEIRSLSIRFSIPKVLFGNNYSNYNPLLFKDNLFKILNDSISKIIEIKINDFKVSSIAVSTNIPISKNPEYYLNLIKYSTAPKIGYLKKSIEYASSVYFKTLKESFLFYDKTEEANLSENILRLEYTIKKTEKLKKLIGSFTIEELFTEGIYNKLVNEFNNKFFQILPIKKLNKTNLLNPLDIFEYLKNYLSEHYSAIVFLYLQAFLVSQDIDKIYYEIRDSYDSRKALKIFNFIQILIFVNLVSEFHPLYELFENMPERGIA